MDGGTPSLSALERMSATLHSRGPDGSGFFQMRHLAVGHRRLQIIDLSDKAQQPMIDNELGLGVVYNGAIYNYKELRAELQSKGYRFFSAGDTEVILKAYAEWGEYCVEHLSGMFAFALWERDSGRLFCARDRLGIKPFYFSQTSKSFRFASTLPALLAAGDIDTKLDPVALHHYMTFHSVVPAPHTMIAGIRKLPPATAFSIEPDGRQKFRQYWSLEYPAQERSRGQSPQLSWEEHKQQVLASLRTAVQRRLVADVPVGVLLSGGLDSSLVVGLLSELGQQDINTFSVGFENVGGETGNEFEYSDLIAKHYGTQHHRLFVDSKTLLPNLRDCVKAMAEPMVSHDVIGFYLLSQQVSQHVKVVQSGQGADEVFAGYHWYPPLLDSHNVAQDYAQVFFDRTHKEYSQAVNPEMVERDYSREFIQEYFRRTQRFRPVEQALHLDTNVMLVDDPVKRVDNMTMAWGLEARVPFLDHDLVELAAKVPAEYKIESGGKFILKEAAREVIPSAVIDRPKGYFPVPALKYLDGVYLTFVQDILNAPEARERHLFQQNYVNRLLEAPTDHITPLRGSKLWQIALLEYWLQTHDV